MPRGAIPLPWVQSLCCENTLALPLQTRIMSTLFAAEVVLHIAAVPVCRGQASVRAQGAKSRRRRRRRQLLRPRRAQATTRALNRCPRHGQRKQGAHFPTSCNGKIWPDTVVVCSLESPCEHTDASRLTRSCLCCITPCTTALWRSHHWHCSGMCFHQAPTAELARPARRAPAEQRCSLPHGRERSTATPTAHDRTTKKALTCAADGHCATRARVWGQGVRRDSCGCNRRNAHRSLGFLSSSCRSLLPNC